MEFDFAVGRGYWVEKNNLTRLFTRPKLFYSSLLCQINDMHDDISFDKYNFIAELHIHAKAHFNSI